METDQGPEDYLAPAKATLELVKSLTNQVGLKHVELPDTPVGVGIAVGFGQTQYVVLSVMGGGGESQLYITSGILRDIKQDRLAALGLCNDMVKNNPTYPIFLHDAEVGWDILVSNVFPVRLLIEVPTFFASAVVNTLPIVADRARSRFSEAGLGGRTFSWNTEDLNRLLIDSML